MQTRSRKILRDLNVRLLWWAKDYSSANTCAHRSECSNADCVSQLCHQELAQGKTLAELVASGWRADEAEAKHVAKELLGVLDYLGSRRPAVTHRRGGLTAQH